jgi:putative dimethyl sulfoxide reductase chaperone
MSAAEHVGTSAALLLTRLWSRPTAEEISVWEALWPTAEECADALELDPDGIERLRAALTESDPVSMCDEYESMLVGPGRPPCLPYESAWSGSEMQQREDGILMSVAAEEVQEIYRDLGLQLAADAHELPDHLVIELEAVAYALEHEREQQATELLQGHLVRWMSPFCASVSGASELRFYAVLAELTPAWTAALST